jgi:hypothetical protein
MTHIRFGSATRALATVGVASLAFYRYALRPRQLRWGATDDEIAAALPGDDLLAGADLTATRAITVDRRPDDVWPWIAQLGQGRSRLSSYDVLENLVGCDMHSADRVVAEWQDVVRERYLSTRWWSGLLVEPVAIVSFVMSQKMLRGIRQRARQGSFSPVV